jgi:hypothetical protein
MRGILKIHIDKVRSVSVLFLVIIGLFVAMTTHAQQKNKLVDFKSFGQWEIWCIDIAQSGQVKCNLNQVLRYKNHPDFRAMIPRFFTNGEHLTRMEIDREWQTGFSRGYIQVDNQEPVSLSGCDNPCVIVGEELSRLVHLFMTGKKASIHFHDYLVEEFDVTISLANFVPAANTLVIMQPKD